MELMKKQGVKQTEVGVIPEDWKLVPLDEIFTFYSTSNYSKAQMSEDDEVGCIHYGLIHAIKNTKYDLKHGIKYYVTSEQAKYEIVRDGDVIMVDASEDLEGVNKSVEVFGVGSNKYISGLHTYLLRDKKSLLADNFRGIILNSPSVKNQMLQLAVGMKVFGVSKTQLVNVKIPLPQTLTEQKAIAAALSDVDALITSLDRTITKKKAIKQGAMQQLLTPPHKGGKRLLGFDGEWVEKTLGELGECIIGLTYKPADVSDSGTLVLRSSNIQNDQLSFKDNVFVKSEIPEKLRTQIDDILVCVRNGSRNLIGKCARIDGRCLGESFGAFMSIYRSPYNRFISHVFKSYSIQKQIEENLGATINQITNKTLNSFRIWFPENEKERNSIANFIDDMDAEIKQLESKQAKHQAIKQGMMQELLTGKTRLV